jgi:hypothetical protein
MALRLEPALIQRTGNRLDVIAAYAAGTVAAFWLIERTTAFCVRSAKVAQAAPEVSYDFRFWHFSDMANLAGDVRF